MPPRYPANPNQIKLNLDFDTIDRLRAVARERQQTDLTRCAYQLLQEALGMRAPAPIVPAAEPASDITFDWRKICAPPPRS